MATKTFLAQDAVHEQSDAEFECVFIEAAPGQPQLVAAAIVTINATLKNVATGEVINFRDGQNVKGANGGVLASTGVFTLSLGALDNIIVSAMATPTTEKHRLTLEVTYSKTAGGTGALTHEVVFYVLKLADVS